MSLKHFLLNIKKRGLKDVTNPDVVSAFLEWEKIESEGLTLPASELRAYSEQVVYRMSRCQDCVEAGVCKVCGCKMPEAMLAPGFHCKSEPSKFDKMLPAELWENHKKMYNINFFVDHD